MSAYPSAAEYSAQVKSVFKAEVGDGIVELVLETVSESTPQGPYERFALEFSGPQPVLSQATYRLRHGIVGAHDVFLVPVSEDADGARYEAVFAVRTGDAEE